MGSVITPPKLVFAPVKETTNNSWARASPVARGRVPVPAGGRKSRASRKTLRR
jgi:hypothetical protein